jgi:hypothetical protein
MQTFWVTWVDGTSGGYGSPHPTFDEAQKEAERLAQMPNNVGKPVRVLQYLGTVTCKNTIWEPAEIEELPF